MKKFEADIIKGLKPIDENSVNMNRKEIEQIIHKLIEIAQKEESEVWQTFLYSELAYYNGKLHESYELTLKAYELDKKNVLENGGKVNYYILNSLAVSYYSLKEYEMAEKCYSEVIKLNPKYYQAYIDIATVYRNMGRFDEAMERINKVLKKVKEGDIYYQAIEAKGRLLVDLQKYMDANEILLSIYKQKGNDAEYLDALAVSFVYLNEYNKAKKYYSEALKICKDKTLEVHIKIKLESLEIHKENEEISESEELILGLSKDRTEIIEKVFFNMKNKLSLVKKYSQRYIDEKKKRPIRYNKNYLVCLKGWSSSTPEISLGISEEDFRYGAGFI